MTHITDLGSIPVLGFIAPSGTGKTTLLKALIPILKSAGLRIALIKHSHHRITFDDKGTTMLAFEAGAGVYAETDSPTCLAMQKTRTSPEEESLYTAIQQYQMLPIDLILVEGFKTLPYPKVEIFRSDYTMPTFYQADDNVLALIGDADLDVSKDARLKALKKLPLRDVAAIAAWIQYEFLEH